EMVAAVDRSGHPVQVEIGHEAQQRRRLLGVARPGLEQGGEQEEGCGNRRDLDRERPVGELERDREHQHVERPPHDRIEWPLAVHRSLRASSRPRRSTAACASAGSPVTSATPSTAAAVATTPPDHATQWWTRIRSPNRAAAPNSSAITSTGRPVAQSHVSASSSLRRRTALANSRSPITPPMPGMAPPAASTCKLTAVRAA